MSVKELTKLSVADLWKGSKGLVVDFWEAEEEEVRDFTRRFIEGALEAERAYEKWALKWRPIAPKAVRCLEKDLEEMLNFYSCPRQIWAKVRTTNAIERAFREGRRRTRPMSSFNHDQSIERGRLCRAKPPERTMGQETPKMQ